MICILGDLCHRKPEHGKHDDWCYERAVVHHLRKQSNLLTEIRDLLIIQTQQEEIEMATLEDFQAASAAISSELAAARDDLANIAADETRQNALIETQTAKIAELEAIIAAGTSDGSMTAEQEQAALAEVQARKDEIAELQSQLAAAAATIPEA